ncbi:MAG: SH3 domain-containing protein [Dehalococcoidia bacterium]
MGSRPASALDPENAHDRIALAALSHEGEWGGQCWQFMKDVVREATGKEIGFDYREGFFEAGAVEITDISQARAGDIIQVALDSWTSPDADYPGLHTSIVMTNLGDGVFDVVDSNQNWDEMVRVRAGYKPFEAAAQSGLQVHIYRIPGDGTAEAPPYREVIPRGDYLRTGESGRVNAPGECLNLRTGGGLGNGIITCLPHGTHFTVTAETVPLNGHNWAKVRTDDGHEGWVATEFVMRDTVPASSTAGGLPIMPFRLFVAGLSFN